MKKKMPYVLAGILLMISLVCMACGSTQEATALPDDANESIQDEEDEDLQNDPNDGLGGDLNEDTVNDFSGFEGIWLGEANNDYDYMEFDSEGNWTLYLSGEVMDEGYLRYEPEWEAIYAYSNRDDSGSRIAMEEGQLYSAAYGYFNPGEGMEYLWYKDGGEFTEDDEPVAYVENGSGGSGNQNAHPDSYWSWDSDLCQRNVSEFEGVWYYDGDLSAEMYVVIDGNGDWSYYQRAPGAEAAEMDHGIFTYSTDETSTYYADSTVYDGVSYKVFDFDSDMLIWGDEGAITGWSDGKEEQSMKKRQIKRFFLTVPVVLGLSLVACGASGDVAGDDWRTSGVVAGSGTITHDGESDVLVSFIDEYGDNLSTITIGEEDQDTAEETDPAMNLEDYVGLWEYQGENRWLRIHDDSTWEFVNDQDDVIESGTLWVEENGITLHFDGSGDTLQLDLTISGDLMDLTNGGSLFPVEAIQSSVPYFTRNGLEMNAEVELGTFLLANGASSYSGEGNGYRRSDCYWEVTKKADDIHNGIRDLHFDAICYIPESAISTAANGTVVVSSELYDAYTGMWLTAGSTFNNSSRGDNYYLHTVSWRGNSYLIEFTYSTDWNFQVGDWGAVLTKSYSVYMPADYDGLVFAAQAEPDTYQESARKMQLDSISPEACVLDLDTLEPYSSLYFSLCD